MALDKYENEELIKLQKLEIINKFLILFLLSNKFLLLKINDLLPSETKIVTTNLMNINIELDKIERQILLLIVTSSGMKSYIKNF